jgi:MoaA/NifB/PqqE/SkfB family radical SAM enzyme
MRINQTGQMTGKEPTDQGAWRFSDLLEEPSVRLRWNKVRQYFFLRESTYDLTNRCNLRCDGCYYYKGDKQFARNETNAEKWRQLIAAEKQRGITYAVLAGAEPSLVPEICQVCFDEIPLGAIATNGVKKIPDSIGYRIHISVWGNDQTSERYRKAKDLLQKQIANYRGDPRAVFVYTFTRTNIEEAHTVIEALARANLKATFNVFSPPVGYRGELEHSEESLACTRKTMLRLLAQYPDTLYFSSYNAVAHTSERGLHDLFECSYPRRNPSRDIGLGRSFRQYRADLTWDRSAACCVPDTDCAQCRHYAAGSAVVTARLYRHAVDPDTFKAWLDYVDTYLAVWVMGYAKGQNLNDKTVSPPKPKRSEATISAGNDR